MKPQIDTAMLEEAINEIKDERFKKDLREWLVYTAPPEVQEIWRRYVEKAEAHEVRRAELREEFAKRQAEMEGWFKFIVAAIVIASVCFCTYQIYEMFTMVRCIK